MKTFYLAENREQVLENLIWVGKEMDLRKKSAELTKELKKLKQRGTS
jgi:hypothetical protein